MIHTLDLTRFLPLGSKALIGAHVVPFPGDPKHRNVGYDQNNMQVIRRQMDLMQDCGIGFVSIDWYGTLTRSNSVLLGWILEAERRGQFKIVVMADHESDPQNLGIFSSPAYLDRMLLTFPNPWSGPIVPNVKYLGHGTGFLWMEIPKAGSTDTPLSILKRQYTTSQVIMGAVFSGFDDSLPVDRTRSVWNGPARRIDDTLGETWLDCWKALPTNVPYVQLVTWNDYEEGTSFERLLSMFSGTRIP